MVKPPSPSHSFPEETNTKGLASFLQLAVGISILFSVFFLVFNLFFPVYYDDALISMRISRNFMEGNGLFHNLEEKVQTNTSLLYPVLVAPFQLLPQDLAIKANVCFDFLISFFNILLIFNILSHLFKVDSLSAKSRVTLIVLLNLAFFTSRIITLGMETQVYLLLILTTFYLIISRKNWFWISYLTTFCRPEGSLLGIIYGAQKFFEKKEWFPQLKLGAFGLLIIGFYSICLFLIYGSWVPYTMEVKWNLKPVIFDSLHYFIFRVLFNTRYPLQMVVHGLGLWFLVLNWKKEEIRLMGLFILFYALLFNVLAGGNSFFGWYQAPVKLFLLILFGLQLADWMKEGSVRVILIVFGFLSIQASWRFWYESTQFNQNGIMAAGKMLNQLTENKPYIITSEPLGFLSYYNMNCQFRDYPGLASKISLGILKQYGPITRANYFDNIAFKKIIQQAGSHLILLSRPEFDSFQEMMTKEFIYLCRVGKYSPSEYNSEFLVFANPKVLGPNQIERLKNRARIMLIPLAK